MLKPLVFTPKEQIVLDLLETSARSRHITVRIVGGWLRDKLLGLPTEDIDISIDKVSGEEFVNFDDFPQHSVKFNPTQSKHLASAVLTIGDYSIDVNQLRKDEYSLGSRIPQVSIGTPTEDAFRRDFTINSLFYNVNSKEIEDFTGRGIKDLQERRISTTINATESFTQDPLRILRGIRFASKLQGFNLGDLECEAILEMGPLLRDKVSSERISQELVKGISCGNSLRYLKEEAVEAKPERK